MAAFNKFNCFVADLANKVHNLGSDTLQVALTDISPVSTNTVLSDITQVIYHTSTRVISVTSSTQTSGLYKLIASVLVLTANADCGPFRYVVIFNNSAASKQLIGWYDYGSELTLNSGDTLSINFDQTNGILQLT